MSRPPVRPPPSAELAGPCLLRVEIARSGPTAEVRLIGELDLSTRGVLVDALARGVSGATLVRLDLTRLDFCDAAGITELLEARAALALDGQVCSTTRPSAHLRRLFVLADLTDMVEDEPAPALLAVQEA